MEKNLIELTVSQNDEGYLLKLDEKELCYVENYKVESSANLGVGVAKLTLEMLVKFPISQENTLRQCLLRQ